MKKLIISAIAAASLLFGFASCSGDLHDAEYTPIKLDGYVLSGGWNGWTGDLKTGLTGTSVELDSIVPDADDDQLVLVINNGKDYQKTLKAGILPDGMSIGGVGDGYGGKNPSVTGFKKGYTYKVVLDTSKGSVEVSVEITDSPAPTPENLPDANKLVLFIGSFGDPVDVKWNGNVGTAVVKKGTALTAWGAGKFECAIVEDTSWKGKFCGVTLAKPGEVKALVSEADNMVLSEFADKDVADKDVTLTFTIIPAETWDGSNNSFTEKAIITASYSLSE